MPSLEIGGRTLSWREAGEGPPALLLHCSLAHSGAWAGVMARLSGHLAMRAPDLPGHGATTHDPAVPTQDEALADALRLLEGQAPAHVIGHSFGGTVALRLAAEHPGRVASLTLFEPVQFSLLAETDPEAHAQERRDAAEALEAALDEDWETAARAFLDRWGTPWESLPTERAASIMKVLPLTLESNLCLLDPAVARIRPDDLGRIRCPVLLLAGGASPPVVRRINAVIASRIPGARSLSLPGVDHMGPITHPDRVADAILDMIAPGSVRHARPCGG